MSGCVACDKSEIPPPTRYDLWAEALIREHHALLSAAKEREERLRAFLGFAIGYCDGVQSCDNHGKIPREWFDEARRALEGNSKP